MTAPPWATSLVTTSVRASSARLALALSSEAPSAIAATSCVFVIGFCVIKRFLSSGSVLPAGVRPAPGH